MKRRSLWWAWLLVAACSGGNEGPQPGSDASHAGADAGGVSDGDDVESPDAGDAASGPDVAEDTPLPDVVEDVPATGDVWDGDAVGVASDAVRLALAGGEASGGGVRLRCALSWAPTAAVASGENVQVRPPLAAGVAEAASTEGGE